MKSMEIIRELKSVTSKSGYKIITIAALFKAFGYSKRSDKNVRKVQEILRKNSLYVFPLITMESNWRDSVRIYSFPVEALGDLFESEKELEGYVHIKQKYRQLGIHKVTIQYSPKQTRDRLDMLGENDIGEKIVLEFKNKDGGKSAVEQVLRYMGMVRQENPGAKIRGVLVTGVRGVDTAKAIYGMSATDRENFKWYLYSFDRKRQTLDFKEVNFSTLNKFLKL
jgi:hypothetical protein